MSFARLPALRHGLMTRDKELLPDAVISSRIERVRELMKEGDLASLIVYSDPTRNGPVCYLTNYPCFGLGRRATAVLGRTDGPLLFTAEPSRNLPRVRLFTACDIEKTRQFLSVGCERAAKLAGAGTVGLVGFENLPTGLLKDTACLKATRTRDVSEEYALLVAEKDEAGSNATKRALALAAAGLRLLSERATPGNDLWELAADVDHRLRRAGCEDTNILVNASSAGRLRPAYPKRGRPVPGDTLVCYVAVQLGRHWGVAGATTRIGGSDGPLAGHLSLLRTAKEKAASRIRAGMSLGAVEAAVRRVAGEAGLSLAEDVPVATGVGFDLHEYPFSTDHRVGSKTALQLALTADFADGLTAMEVGMLEVAEHESRWLIPESPAEL